MRSFDSLWTIDFLEQNFSHIIFHYLDFKDNNETKTVVVEQRKNHNQCKIEPC